jgi:hypothetical protein
LSYFSGIFGYGNAFDDGLMLLISPFNCGRLKKENRAISINIMNIVIALEIR